MLGLDQSIAVPRYTFSYHHVYLGLCLVLALVTVSFVFRKESLKLKNPFITFFRARSSTNIISNGKKKIRTYGREPRIL